MNLVLDAVPISRCGGNGRTGLLEAKVFLLSPLLAANSGRESISSAMETMGTSSTRNCLPPTLIHCLFTSTVGELVPNRNALPLPICITPKLKLSSSRLPAAVDTVIALTVAVVVEEFRHHIQRRGFGLKQKGRRLRRLLPQYDVLFETGFCVGIEQIGVETTEGIGVYHLIARRQNRAG